ncbi:MAG: hypothetical protein M1833_001524 [Piccolia ochrophora]|nr:MAG: hypothetical protein M1833_001524 [Piccolia ochrophora]
MTPPRRTPSAARELSGPAKLEEVTELLGKLKVDLAQTNLFPPRALHSSSNPFTPLSDEANLSSERNTILEQLKVHGRDLDNADPIVSKEVRKHLIFSSNSPTTSREALRCLANALFLKPETRQVFVDLSYAPKAAERLKGENRDDEFLVSRVLFLTTYDTNLNFERLIDEHHLAEHINARIAQHSRQYSKSVRKIQTSAQDDAALAETLKLIFNITHYYPDRAHVFSRSIPHILKILTRRKLPNLPLQSPICYLINALMNLDLEDKKNIYFGVNPLFPKFDQKCNADRLINILDSAVERYSEAELDQVGAPLTTLLRRVYEIAPEGVKRYMQWLLLPSDDERGQPIGKSDTLASRLLRLSTSPLAPALRENISSLFFELSDKDATSFVQNVGYGFAAGFLLTHNLPIPENAKEAWSTAGGGTAGDTTNGTRKVDQINPVTGQRLSAESSETLPEMTQAEKEREAERLFVLFERLKKTGIVNVQNPVEMAVQEGRFEELADDAED